MQINNIDFENNFEKIKDQIVTKNQVKQLTDVFIEKNLGYNVVTQLLAENIQFEMLSNMEKIALCTGLYEKLGFEMFKPSLYFSNDELFKYKMFVGDKAKTTNTIDFDNVVKYDDNCYICSFWNPINQVKARLNKNIGYDFDMQRDATFIKTKNGIKRKITLNRKSVDGIKETIRNNQYYPLDMITLAVIVLDDKEIMFDFSESHKHIQITNIPELESPNTTRVFMIDGWHRDTAIWELYEEGFDFSNFKGFPVQIAILTPELAAAFVERQSKANQVTSTRVATKTDTSYNSIIDNLNNKQNKDNNSIFYHNIAQTFSDMKRESKLMNYENLTEALAFMSKKYGLDINNIARRMSITSMIQENVNLTIEILKLKDEKLSLIKENKGLLNLLTILSYEIKISEKDKFDLLSDFADKLSQNENMIKKMKLNNKVYDLEKSYNEILNLL